MKKRTFSVTLGAVLALLASMPLAAEIVTNMKVPVAIPVAIPCTGDFVVLTGDLHVLIASQTSASGNTSFQSHFQPQGISGLSALGVKYQGTGLTGSSATSNSTSFENTLVNNFRIIGQGPRNDVKVHATLHVTVVNGIPTATVENASSTCGTGG
jgi:hypothetical protein